MRTVRARKPNDLSGVKVHFYVGKAGYSCRVSLLQPVAGAPFQPLLAFHIHEDANGLDPMGYIAAQYDLTDREHQVLKGIAVGLTCKEVAEQMSISPNTVKAFLRLIMIKMGVTGRAGIISKVLECSQRGSDVRAPN
ncbi:MAG TPA: helix-turn-helix transcriptional regulator [Bryobacteraceae bacterium]|nr:helix-turn-helix transcriptional regulator [Bryobacteraceae bacterium]